MTENVKRAPRILRVRFTEPSVSHCECCLLVILEDTATRLSLHINSGEERKTPTTDDRIQKTVELIANQQLRCCSACVQLGGWIIPPAFSC